MPVQTSDNHLPIRRSQNSGQYLCLLLKNDLEIFLRHLESEWQRFTVYLHCIWICFPFVPCRELLHSLVVFYNLVDKTSQQSDFKEDNTERVNVVNLLESFVRLSVPKTRLFRKLGSGLQTVILQNSCLSHSNKDNG